MSEDLDLLQGTWIVTSLKMDGEEMPANMLAGRITVRGKSFVSAGMGAEYKGTLELDTSKRPRQLNMKFDHGPEKNNTNLCIYEIDGDAWRLCIATQGTVRPSRFVSPAGSGFALETLQRADGVETTSAKPRAKAAAKPAAVKSARAGGKAAETELEGEWSMISGTMSGKAMEDSMVQWVKRVTQGTETGVYAGPQVMMKAQFTIDPSKSPKTIDYVNTAGSNKGKKQQGIYDLKGDVLKICMAAPGSRRPKKFESAAGDGGTLTVWKRA